MRRWIVAVTLAVVSVVAGPGVGVASAASLPRSVAAVGDSITQAVDVCCRYGNHPSNSRSTGWASADGVSSHCERIRAANPGAIAYNDAVSGARISDAPGQASRAVGQGAQYVTIMMGVNDLCTSSTATMTSVDTFRSQFRQTLTTLGSGAPNARIFVVSIPSVYHLWELYRYDLAARSGQAAIASTTWPKSWWA
jgi:lysophospholipase L1-like esterase